MSFHVSNSRQDGEKKVCEVRKAEFLAALNSPIIVLTKAKHAEPYSDIL